MNVTIIGEIPSKYGTESFMLSDGRIIPNDQSNIKYETIVTQGGRHKEHTMTLIKERITFTVYERHINLDGSCDYTTFINARSNGSHLEYYKTTRHTDKPQFKTFNQGNRNKSLSLQQNS